MNARYLQVSLFLLCAVLLACNVALYLRLSSQTSRLHQAFVALQGQVQTDSTSSRTAAIHTSKAVVATSRDIQHPPATRLRQFKQARSPDLAGMAIEFDSMMSKEPSLPQVERQQYDWLRGALQRMPDTSPRAKDLQTTCQGRRCLISAVFDGDDEARSWARRYLLAGGGRVLPRSRSLVIPLDETGDLVSLQLYLY